MAPTSPTLWRFCALTALTLLLAALFVGGEQPGAGNLFPPPWDKLAHLCAFGGFTLLAGLAFPALPLPGVLLLCTGLGIADEIHQIFIAGRQPGLDDLAADCTGGLLALPLLALLRRLMQRPPGATG